ncbi:hypothetical protein E3N88_08459 [Mikania micrantha]|uniref:Uncharacterized protein n=1 Tax=Mikania micrantha TaxID=192012 RepID=A0A5N6PIJ3_9ASTR|nr:hypothetical protein E3N88_08459 [Mikania micrantha]
MLMPASRHLAIMGIMRIQTSSPWRWSSSRIQIVPFTFCDDEDSGDDIPKSHNFLHKSMVSGYLHSQSLRFQAHLTCYELQLEGYQYRGIDMELHCTNGDVVDRMVVNIMHHPSSPLNLLQLLQ